jgi:hypothetical protein
MRNSQVPSLSELQVFDVNRRGEYEGIRQSFYSFLAYPTAGQLLFTFFQSPLGASGSTLETTNLRSAGQLPQPQNFLVESIEVHYYSGTAIGLTGAAAAAPIYANEAFDIYANGSLEFFIGSKNYLEEAPIMCFPPKTKLRVDSAIALDVVEATAEAQTSIVYAAASGRPYWLDPPVLLVPNQNFDVKIRYGSLHTVAVAGRIGVKLDGILYRQSQ